MGKTIVALGDSLTYNWGLRKQYFWPERLAVRLRAMGMDVKARNLGWPGHTTRQLVRKVWRVWGKPDLVVIWGGVNDPGNGISSEETTANVQRIVDRLKAKGVTKLVVVSPQFLNYPRRDTVDRTGGHSGQWHAYREVDRALREVQGVVYVDLYAFMQQRIIDRKDDSCSASWHIGPRNQHLNAYGQELVAEAIVEAIRGVYLDPECDYSLPS